MRKIGGTCEDDNCPTLYATDRGTVIVRGLVVSDAQALTQLGLPTGETAVEVPVELLASFHAGA
nr:hypothetical protein [Streptomonospora nanhaiensis]